MFGHAYLFLVCIRIRDYKEWFTEMYMWCILCLYLRDKGQGQWPDSLFRFALQALKAQTELHVVRGHYNIMVTSAHW